MFKSVFTKYISVFMLILVLSFLVLTSILSALVNTYSMDVKMNSMANAAYSVSMNLRQGFLQSQLEDYQKYIYERKAEILPLVRLLDINIDDLVILITDADGRIVTTGGTELTGKVEGSEWPTALPKEIYNALVENGSLRDKESLGGFFSVGQCTYGISIEDNGGHHVGAVLASTGSEGMSELLVAMNKTILMSTLWIMLAALVAVYFITERMVAPLRTMSRAAKSFAAGKFDVRIPVTGSDEIAELAQAFNNMLESLSALDEMQRSFVANVSHDLRTPMTTISGFIDGILSGAIPKEKQEYYLGVIATEVRRLSRLVNALLDISRMQAGERKFNMVSIDICELARLILISFEQRIEEKNLRVSFDCDSDRMEVLADRDSIHQVLYNICDNAVKFSNEGGEYRISVHERDKKIELSVYNTGAGIPPEDLPHIFDRFYKSDKSRGLDKTGVGLGMYISRAIIEAHGEQIGVESEYGKWCRFTFTLPRETVQKLPKSKGE